MNEPTDTPTPTNGDPLAALRNRQAAEADAEREAGIDVGAEPNGPEQTREPDEGGPGFRPLPTADELRKIPATAEDVRLLRADIRNLGYRLTRTEKRASREQLFVWAELAIILLILTVHSRTIGKLLKAAA